MLPITFGLQVKTVATENSYNTKLLSATYDAMSAFEINTANEELSSVADSMRSIILASNNIFLNSLATNLGISNSSKEYLQPYIPAVLYTMYDGYYIYAPTETPVVAEKKEEDANGLITTKGYVSVGDDGTDGLGGIYGDVVYEKEDGSYTINKNEARKQTDYVLKSYVQYSARYTKGNKDVTINYTLDNYLNIVGKIGDIYYTKTGYLIKKDLVSDAYIDGNYDLTHNNEDDAKNKILGLKTNANETTIPAAQNVSVKVNGESEIKAEWGKIVDALRNLGYYEDNVGGSSYPNIRTMSDAKTYLKRSYEEKQTTNLSDIQNLQYEIEKYDAITYYISSSIFSNWVYANLADLTYGDIQDDAMTQYYEDTNYQSTAGAGTSDLYYSFEGNGTPIFDQAEDPEDAESKFNTHKMEVIKNSIKYNLNLSISAYCKMNGSYDFSLPILLDEEWDKILSNISIVSFMQGFDCGLDIYNNYEIVSSTNNELMVTPSEIYYVPKSQFNDSNSSYHRIDCPVLGDSSDGYISFKSKEVKYDKVYDSSAGIYKFDHKNLACYTCINNNNYSEDSQFVPNAASYYEKIQSLPSDNKRIAGYIGLAKERQNIYKTNALPVSEGYEIIKDSEQKIEMGNGDYQIISTKNCSKIKKVQITFASTISENTSGSREPILKLKARFNGNDGQVRDINLNLDQAKEQTVTLDVSDIDAIYKIELSKQTPNYKVKYNVVSIKVMYK